MSKISEEKILVFIFGVWLLGMVAIYFSDIQTSNEMIALIYRWMNK
jgi:hypothetical protein